MKLFVASGIFHPESGGPATYLHEILPALQSRAWDVRLLSYGDATNDDYPYPVTRIPRRFLPIRRLGYALASRDPAQWADLIYAHTIDLPVAWGETPRIIKIVGDQAWERCIRRGWIPPTEDIDYFQQGTYGRIVNWQRESRSRQVRAFDAVIVPSNYLKQMVVGWGVAPERVHVVYNALPPAPQLEPVTREQLGWDAAPTILTAARLTAWKGVDHLIRAVEQIPDVRLIIAGDGDELPRLKAMTNNDRIRFLGRVPRLKLYQMMQAADYFALYSGYEGLPHTLLEALRVGTPVIASAKGGNPEVVQHNENGLLVPYVDVEALTTTIREAISTGKRKSLAANTASGMERFTFERMVTETDAALRQYVGI